MKNSLTFIVCAAIIGSYANITASSSSNRIATTVQKDAQQNSDAQRMQNYVEQYRSTLDFPDMSEEDSKKFVNALENADMNDAIKKLNAILNRPKLTESLIIESECSKASNIDNQIESQFLTDLDNDIKCCTAGIPRLKNNLNQHKQELSSRPAYKDYLRRLTCYYNKLNKSHEINQNTQEDYPIHTDLRKNAIIALFYAQREQLGEDYQQYFQLFEKAKKAENTVSQV